MCAEVTLALRSSPANIQAQRLPTAQHGSILHCPARHAACRESRGVERGCACFAHAVNLAQCLRIRRKHGRERSEMRDQILGQRLGIALPDGGEKEEFEQFVIGQRLRATVQQALAQPLAMAGSSLRRRFFRIARQPIPPAPRFSHLHCL